MRSLELQSTLAFYISFRTTWAIVKSPECRAYSRSHNTSRTVDYQPHIDLFADPSIFSIDEVIDYPAIG